MLNLRVVLLGAPTSLARPAPWWSVRRTPRRRHIRRRSSEAGQREHMARQGITVGNWSECRCLGGSLAPPRVLNWGLRGWFPLDFRPLCRAASRALRDLKTGGNLPGAHCLEGRFSTPCPIWRPQQPPAAQRNGPFFSRGAPF
jgi:hypothetical protein